MHFPRFCRRFPFFQRCKIKKYNNQDFNVLIGKRVLSQRKKAIKKFCETADWYKGAENFSDISVFQ